MYWKGGKDWLVIHSSPTTIRGFGTPPLKKIGLSPRSGRDNRLIILNCIVIGKDILIIGLLLNDSMPCKPKKKMYQS